MSTDLKEYSLCNYCLSRNSGVKKRQGTAGKNKKKKNCYICRGLMQQVNSMAKKIISLAKGYEFQTFLVGATLPAQIYDREDVIRARLKIRGRENVKNQLTRELGMLISRSAKKKVDYLKPDITVNLVADKENNVDFAIKSRPLTVSGRYLKKVRGIPQRQEKKRCPECEGNGCDKCDRSGLVSDLDSSSVESIIGSKLVSLTKGQSPKFSWIGGEDQNSLVLGNGRPFFAKIFDPKIRKLKKNLKSGGEGINVLIDGMLEDIPDSQIAFRTKTRVVVKCDREITKPDISKLRGLAGTEVKFQNKSRTMTKKLHSVSVRSKGKDEFVMTIEADGGLTIKQFVGGQEFMDPNISSIIGTRCECVSFDVLGVDVQ